MLDNCHYDKIKLTHELSCILWFIEKHAKAEAQKAGDAQCSTLLNSLSADLQKYIKQLHGMCCNKDVSGCSSCS